MCEDADEHEEICLLEEIARSIFKIALLKGQVRKELFDCLNVLKDLSSGYSSE